MKWKLNVFTVFIILLIILVLFIMINKQFTIKETKETFVDFYKDNATNSLTVLNIPQYSSDSKRLVVHLYDNLYFDDKNGAIIEVVSSQTSGQVAQDTKGTTITDIHIYPRNGGLTHTTYSNTVIKENGDVVGFDTNESKITTITPSYDDFSQIGNIIINNVLPIPSHTYQYFYYTWNKQTFIHLFKFNTSESGSGSSKIKIKQLIFLRSFVFGESGLKSVFDDITPSTISTASPEVTDNGTASGKYKDDNNKKLVSSPAPLTGTALVPRSNSYLDNTIKVFQITPYVFYDTARGIIIINTPDANSLTIPKLEFYDNTGNSTTPELSSKPIEIGSGTYKIFAKRSPSGMVLVTSYTYNTIISVIAYTTNKSNEIVVTQRFNNKENKLVNNLASDPEYISATSPPPTTAPATTPPGGWDEWNKNFNNKWNQLYDGKMNCGSDKSCWYWFFKSLPSENDRNDMSNMYGSNNGQSFFSDDYFLKTEAVPPVCPQCPNCPSSGTCTSCGGNGGSGTTLSSCSGVDLHLTPIVSTKYTDNLGNIYIATTDNSGNKSYRLEGKISAAGTTSASSTTTQNSVASIDNNISGVANNLVNTAGGAVGTAGNLAFSAGSGAVNLLRDTGSGAVDLLKDTGSGAVDLLKDTGSGAIGLLKDAGSGIANLGSGRLQMQGSQYNSAGGAGAVGAGGVGPSQLGSVSDKSFGKMSGQTPVDNYSYYGALQSKGGNFMPVTADFSSFRK